MTARKRYGGTSSQERAEDKGTIVSDLEKKSLLSEDTGKQRGLQDEYWPEERESWDKVRAFSAEKTLVSKDRSKRSEIDSPSGGSGLCRSER